eukprot:Nitzschia sp. Nitz4//scaffold517_size4071//2291//3964//NITZ4_009255-RA/size4071-processed-gene-0.3-mRNA-1//-1//CDS//3329553799//1943//frame0
METNSRPGRILCTQTSADILREQGPDIALARRGKISVKGKGSMFTYWVGTEVQIDGELPQDTIATLNDTQGYEMSPTKRGTPHGSTTPRASHVAPAPHEGAPIAPVLPVKQVVQQPEIGSEDSGSHTKETASCDMTSATTDSSERRSHLIEWGVSFLVSHLQLILAKRATQDGVNPQYPPPLYGSSEEGHVVLDEFKDRIAFPDFDAASVQKLAPPESIELDEQVLSEIRDYVSVIASLYRPNPFHSFEHANHAVVAVEKLMRWIVRPDGGLEGAQRMTAKVAGDVHKSSFGISSDPLAQLACVFSALIHDVDHPGVTNAILVSEGATLAKAYKNKSVAEQNSVDIAWELLMTDRYKNFRNCAFVDGAELARFRQMVVNMVLATDSSDNQINATMRSRWERAFSDGFYSKETVDVKATLVLEMLMQASDNSHIVQEWSVFVKWNQRLFNEVYGAYKKGRISEDPSETWYEHEMGFHDSCIIPMAKKLDASGVFRSGISLASYALANRQDWERQGQNLVKSFKKAYDAQHPSYSSKSEGGGKPGKQLLAWDASPLPSMV